VSLSGRRSDQEVVRSESTHRRKSWQADHGGAYTESLLSIDRAERRAGVQIAKRAKRDLDSEADAEVFRHRGLVVVAKPLLCP
jgi:hypothetical protein